MIRQRKDRDGLQVQVYAGRDPLTGRKRYVSRQIPGSGRAAMKHAKQIEAQLLAEVGAGRHQRSAMTLAQLFAGRTGQLNARAAVSAVRPHAQAREHNGRPLR